MINPHSIEKDVFEFFFVFSRFEFALKQSGYITTSSPTSDNAIPDWDALVKDYKKVYVACEETEESIKYLLEKPPNRQTVYREESGALQARWKPITINSNAPLLYTLVDIVKVVRNNLFHGGKYGDNGWDDEARVSLLLKHSINVIHHWLQLREELNVYYTDQA